MNAHAGKTQENRTQSVANVGSQMASGSGAASQFVDNRPEAVAQRKLQTMVNYSAQVRQLRTVQKMANNSLQAKRAAQLRRLETGVVVQRDTKKGPDGDDIEVTEVDDYLPNCVDNNELSRKMYRSNGGISEGWNDTDLFYADGDGDLVRITTAMVNAFWDPKYEGFAQLSGPDWTKNCEDYAKANGEGEKSGDYSNTEQLAALLPSNGNYVLELGFHWLNLDKTGDDVITIRQKDGESSVYSKGFTADAACEYLLEKRGFGGTVYKL